MSTACHSESPRAAASPQSCPGSQPRPQSTHRLAPGWLVHAAKLGHLLQPRGARALEMPPLSLPLTPGTEGRHPQSTQESGPTPSCSFSLGQEAFPLLPSLALVPTTQAAQGWFCPFPRGENRGSHKDKRRSKQPKNNWPWRCLAQWGCEEPRRAEVSVSEPLMFMALVCLGHGVSHQEASSLSAMRGEL